MLSLMCAESQEYYFFISIDFLSVVSWMLRLLLVLFQSELFLLVTDQGYLTESKAVWETLGNVEGDGHFVDAEFHTYTKPALPPMISSNTSVSSDQQIDQE